MYVKGIGRHEPFNLWHAVKCAEPFGTSHTVGYTTACDLYMVIVQTAESFQNVPLSADLCTTEACNMRKKLSQELNKCTAENRQSEWKVVY